MRKTRRKPKKQNRKEYDFEGEKVGSRLVAMLNTQRGCDVYKVVRGLKRLDEMKLDSPWHQRKESREWRRFNQQAEVITKRLSKYSTRSVIVANELEVVGEYIPGAPVQFRRLHEEYGPFMWVRQPITPTAITMAEVFCISALEQVVNSGWLWKLKVCECKRWFWARKNNQLFCSYRCRQKRWDSSPGNAERRRQRRREAQRAWLFK